MGDMSTLHNSEAEDLGTPFITTRDPSNKTIKLPQHHQPLMIPEAISHKFSSATASEDSAHQKRKFSETDDLSDENLNELLGDGDDIVAPHQPDSEPLPNLPIYHPSVKTIEILCTQMVQYFHSHIKGSVYQDEETKYLLEELDDLMHPPHETNVTRIGLVGDAGQGKSSVLNSILGVENLAIHADDGNSCTYVVQEYAQTIPSQKTPYQAEVEFFCRQACLNMIREQLKSYYDYANMDEEVDEEEAHELRMRSGTALTNFLALYMDQPEFHDKEAAEEFLSSAESGDDPRILKRLIKWTENILEELLPIDNNLTMLNATTVASIGEKILPFTTTVDYPIFEGTKLQCCPWPLVKRVRTFLTSRLLEQRIILADLPGISDKNRSRVEATKRYLQQCDMTIVVNKMGRAIDHDSLHKQINEAFRRRRSGSLMVAITCSDVLNVNGKQTFESTSAEKKALLDLQNEEDKLNKQQHHLKVRLLSPSLRYQSLEKLKLSAKKDRVGREKQELLRKRQELRVLARNRHVKDGISEQYRQDTKDPSPLPVFCISNTNYMQHLAGYTKNSPPQLSLSATGVPTMRNDIYSIPSKGKFASLEHYCKSQLESILNTIEISCTTSKIKRKEDLNKKFNESRTCLKGTVHKVAEHFKETHIDEILKFITKSEHMWINRARRKCERWAELKPAGHAAVMRHYGNWTTKSAGVQNWNEELLIVVRDGLDELFEHVYNQYCDELGTDIAEQVGDTIEHLNTALHVDPAANLSGAILAFRQNLKERRTQIDRVCNQFKARLKQNIRILQLRATTDEETHYLIKGMKNIYDLANKAKPARGQKLHSARCAAFQKALCTHGGVFMEIHKGIQYDFDKFFQSHVSNWVKQLDAIFGKTQHDVSRVCSTKEDDSPEAKKLREELLAMLPEARETLHGEIARHLEICKTSAI